MKDSIKLSSLFLKILIESVSISTDSLNVNTKLSVMAIVVALSTGEYEVTTGFAISVANVGIISCNESPVAKELISSALAPSLV